MNQIYGFNIDNKYYMQGMQKENAPAKQPSKLRNVCGVTAGAIVGLAPIPYVLSESISKISPKDLENQKYMMSMILPNIDTLENTKKNISAIIDKIGLKEKGVELIVASNENKSEITNLLEKSIKGNSQIAKLMRESFLQKFMEGLNAAYLPETRKIIVSQKQGYMSAYHELGHAYDFLKSKFGKILAKGRYLIPFNIPVFAPLFLAVGLLHNKKDIPANEKSKFEKTKDFIKDNAGKLTLLNFAPVFMEEGLASINGLKFAKKYLDNRQFGKLRQGLGLCLGTYTTVAFLFATGVWSAISLKDKIAGTKKAS